MGSVAVALETDIKNVAGTRKAWSLVAGLGVSIGPDGTNQEAYQSRHPQQGGDGVLNVVTRCQRDAVQFRSG